NNQWAISVPLNKQTASKTIAHKALSVGIPAVRVDGNDAIAMYINVQNALEKIRQTQQPFFIEALSYRICDHTTADDASRYMDKSAYEDATKHEPLIRFKQFLNSHHRWTKADDASLHLDCQQGIDASIENYKNLPKQAVGEFFDFMYAQIPDSLAEQRQFFLDGVKRHE
ncbi:MAG: pyruvate dehydrogenase (acetyl-transferring) E1 component subunit alpha, partial [Cycloclasticus sp.]|nr:pyruvate dehydrogenase (acetyl-transferring) E1 component subunit alpha [Cycloclasticus sp.]